MFYTVQTKPDFVDRVFLLLRRTFINIMIDPLLALVIGLLILLVPRFLSYFVALYLTVEDIWG